MFLSCLVSLQISSEDIHHIYWKNFCSSSPRFCIPTSIIFEKESFALLHREKASIDRQIQNIACTNVMIGIEQIQINPVFIFSMINRKRCNNLSDTTSAFWCYLCKAISKDFNNILKILDYLNVCYTFLIS